MLKLLSLGLPTIVSPYTEPFAGPPNIVTDDAAIGTMAATYLLDRGFRHFAYCGFGDTYYWSRRRGVSFGDTIRGAGFDVHCYEYEQPGTKTPHSWEKEQAILTDWLRGLPQPVGLMACNDDRCQDILEACKAAGLHVPEQVAIVGVGNDDLVCDLAAPPLSSVALSAQKAGYEAAAILDRWMGGDKIASLRVEVVPPSNRGQDARDTRTAVGDPIIVRPSRVVTRQSTDVFAVPDRQVVEALRFIHTCARKEAIQVDDVLRSVPVSRRSLYDRFARTLGRSVHEEIKRVRVDELTHLLVDTDLPMSQLALQLGCPDIKNLARYFKQSTGVTPLQYRHRHSPQ